MLGTLLSLFLLILLASLVTNGIYAATRGEYKTEEDGTICKNGKIFRFWYFYWMQFKGYRDVYFNDDNVRRLWYNMRQMVGHENIQIQSAVTGDFLAIKGNALHVLATITNLQGVKFKLENTNTEWVAAYPYKQYKNYKFPWWIRDAMAGCITCFTSVYGTGIYLLIMWRVSRETLCNTLWRAFPCDTMSDLVINGIITWFLYWMALAFVNTVLWKRLG